ncbi:MAG TPA: hypothetical protein VNN16_00995, partial [Candidatus Sulfotelmatobacter sp.]|nr:hypothetical protein [Candidatus Sulfotelmatobacter sp.]
LWERFGILKERNGFDGVSRRYFGELLAFGSVRQYRLTYEDRYSSRILSSGCACGWAGCWQATYRYREWEAEVCGYQEPKAEDDEKTRRSSICRQAWRSQI